MMVKILIYRNGLTWHVGRAHQHISTSAHQHISTSAHQHISTLSQGFNLLFFFVLYCRKWLFTAFLTKI